MGVIAILFSRRRCAGVDVQRLQISNSESHSRVIVASAGGLGRFGFGDRDCPDQSDEQQHARQTDRHQVSRVERLTQPGDIGLLAGSADSEIMLVGGRARSTTAPNAASAGFQLVQTCGTPVLAARRSVAASVIR